jgi:hypothetical protein
MDPLLSPEQAHQMKWTPSLWQKCPDCSLSENGELMEECRRRNDGRFYCRFARLHSEHAEFAPFRTKEWAATHPETGIVNIDMMLGWNSWDDVSQTDEERDRAHGIEPMIKGIH